MQELDPYWSGTHGLHEELERHRVERNVLCVVLSVVHVLWECSAYSSSRASFLLKLEELLGDRYADFEALNSVEKTSYVLRSEFWEQNFNSLLKRVGGKETKLYGDALINFSLSPHLGVWGVPLGLGW